MSPLERAPTKSGRKTKFGSFKTMEGASLQLTPFKTPGSQTLTSRYMVPVNEVRLVNSDPQTLKSAQPVKEQPSKGPPPRGSRFNPIYIEPGSTSIESTRDLQMLFANSFDCTSDMYGEYDIKTVPPVQHGRCKVPIEYKDEIEKELGLTGNYCKTD